MAALVVLAMTSCGGGGVGADINPMLTIDWPSQTRGISAPAYAASATITIAPTDHSTPVVWTVDRPSGTGAQSVTYTSPGLVSPAPARLTVDFKSGTGGSGTVVASAALDIKIANDGSVRKASGDPIGTIAYATALNGIEITVSDFTVGSTQSASVIGLSPVGEVALPQQLVDLSITGGDQYATLDNGNLTGIRDGYVTLTAKYESLTRNRLVTVKPSVISAGQYAFPVTKIAYDSLHAKIWGTDKANGTIVDIDVITGQKGTPIPVGTNPSNIVISSDGTTAYVALASAHTLPIVDLSSRSITGVIDLSPISPQATPISLSVNPAQANEVCICLHETPNNYTGRGPAVFRNGTLIGQVGSATYASYRSGTEIMTTQLGISDGPMGRYQVTPTSVDLVFGRSTSQYLPASFSIIGSKMVLEGGQAYSTDDLTEAGYYGDGFAIAATDMMSGNIWTVIPGSTPNRVQCVEGNMFKPVLSQVLPNNAHIQQMIRFGATGLAILADGDIFILPTAPGL